AAGVSGGGGNRIVPPPPAPRGTPTVANTDTATPVPSGSTRLRGEGLTSTDLYIGYRALLDRYVDQIDSSTLVRAAPASPPQSLHAQAAPPPTTIAIPFVSG